MRTHAGSTKTDVGAQVRRTGRQVARGWAQRAGGRGGWGRCGRGAEYGGRKSAECMRWKNYWSKCQRVCARKCPSRSTDCICNASTWYFVEPHENVALGAPVSARTRWQNDQYFLENTHSHQKRPGRPEGDQGSPEGNQRAGPSAARRVRRLPGQACPAQENRPTQTDPGTPQTAASRQGPRPPQPRKPGPAPSLGRAGPGRLRSERRSAARHAPPGAPRTARSPATRGASASGGRAG